MAFPDIPTVGAGRVLWTTSTSPSGTHTSPNLSSLTKNAGDLLIAVVIIYDGNSTNAEFSSWGGGFTEFGDFAGTTTMGIGVAYKWSTGSETGTFTVTSADTSTNDSAFALLSIPGAHATTPPEAGSFVTGTTAAADPGAFNPAGWGTEDTLWIAVRGSGETGTGGTFTGLGNPPTNYSDSAQSGISADAVGGVEGGVSFRQLNAASEDVGAGTCDVSNARNSALVIAVRPAPAAVVTYAHGQAQAYIKATVRGYAQATALIPNWFFAQSAAMITQGVTSVVDTFTRSETNTLGSADTGGAYTTHGTAADFDVTGTVGTIANWQEDLVTFPYWKMARLPNALLPKVYEAYIHWSLPSLPGSGNYGIALWGNLPSGFSEEQSGNVLGYVRVVSNGDITVYASGDGLHELTLGTYTPGDIWVLKARFIGTRGAGATQVKAWRLADSEPGWQVELPSSALSPHPFWERGHVAFGSISSDPATAITVTVDNYNAYQAYPVGNGQAGAWIEQTYYGLGQAQAQIKTTYYAHGQSQADIKQTYYAHGQAQADIKQTYYVHAQAQAQIIVTLNAFAQAQAQIKTTYYQHAQAQADIKQTYFVHAQAQADIKQTYYVHAQGQAWIEQTYYAHAQAQACIVGWAWAQAQADIKQTYYGHSQAEAWIENTYYGVAQAQARIAVTSFVSAQAQAQIKTTYYQHAQAQANIKATYYAHAQAQADIKQTYYVHAQAQALILRTEYGLGQAQAWIETTYYAHGQAEAWIEATYYGLGQSQATIKQVYVAHAQAQAQIKTTYYGLGQAEAWIEQTYYQHAQAQASILQVYYAPAQAQAWIEATYYAHAQAQAYILGSVNAHGQAQARIIAFDVNVHAQAQALIAGAFQVFAQAQASIRAFDVNAHGQAQGTVLTAYYAHGQSQAWIENTYYGLGQAQAWIETTYYAVAQAQAWVEITTYQHAQAHAWIETTVTATGQAQGTILAVSYGLGQAQGHIQTVGYGTGQAQGQIRFAGAFAQAQAQILQSGDIIIVSLEIADRPSLNLTLSNALGLQLTLSDTEHSIELSDSNY